jgi:hypothetical protein
MVTASHPAQPSLILLMNSCYFVHPSGFRLCHGLAVRSILVRCCQ